MIVIENLSKSYKSKNSEVNVFKEISFNINKGDFIVLTGKSGSGKSTLLSILGLFDEPTNGSFAIEGKDVFSLKSRELSSIRGNKIGFVHQSFNLIDEYSVQENILFVCDIHGVKTDNGFFLSLVRRLGIEDILDKNVSEISGGQQQRVAIARALILKPNLVLMDEPTGNLDEENTNAIIEIIKDMNSNNESTIVMATHDIDLFDAGNRRLEIKNGVVNELH